MRAPALLYLQDNHNTNHMACRAQRSLTGQPSAARLLLLLVMRAAAPAARAAIEWGPCPKNWYTGEEYAGAQDYIDCAQLPVGRPLAGGQPAGRQLQPGSAGRQVPAAVVRDVWGGPGWRVGAPTWTPACSFANVPVLCCPVRLGSPHSISAAPRLSPAPDAGCLSRPAPWARWQTFRACRCWYCQARATPIPPPGAQEGRGRRRFNAAMMPALTHHCCLCPCPERLAVLHL